MGGSVADPKAVSSDGHIYLVNDMVNAIREDRAPYIPGESARKAVDLILAIYESAKTGQEILLNEW